jgi:MFS family permease
VDKHRLVMLTQVLLAADAALLWWLAWSGHGTIGWLLLLAALNGLISAFEIPARQALIIELVGRDDLQAAIALNSSGFNLARIIGPGIAALVIARLGLAWCFALNAFSYLAVLVGLAMMRLPRWKPASAATSALEGLMAGLRYMTTTPSVSTLMKLVTVYSILGIPYLTLMPVVARERLGLDASGYGLLLSAVGAGGVCGALFLAAVSQRIERVKLLTLSSYVFPVLLLAFAGTRSPALATGILLLTGFVMIINNALANSLLQAIVPDAFRGRLMAAYSFVVVGLSQVVGAFVAGAVARVVGVEWAIGGGSIIMVAYAMYVIRKPEIQAL